MKRSVVWVAAVAAWAVAALGATACGKDLPDDGTGGAGGTTTSTTTGAGPCVLDESQLDDCTLE